MLWCAGSGCMGLMHLASSAALLRLSPNHCVKRKKRSSSVASPPSLRVRRATTSRRRASSPLRVASATDAKNPSSDCQICGLCFEYAHAAVQCDPNSGEVRSLGNKGQKIEQFD